MLADLGSVAIGVIGIIPVYKGVFPPNYLS